MEIVHAVCCGLDVHKLTVVACLLRDKGCRDKPHKELRSFGTTTRELEGLASWLKEEGCEHVAMESTGVYWKPVYNVLEGRCVEVLLVNAQHVKNVPGRKTDMKDAEWIATLLGHGLLSGSFIPPPEIRELRELTRYRKTLIQQRADQSNRIQKLLETGNIKLGSVASDVLGKSGMAMLRALSQGETDGQVLAQEARGRLRAKIPELEEALRGILSETQRWLLGEQLEHVSELDERIARLDERLRRLSHPFEEALERLSEVPGVSRRVAEVIVSEIGLDMSRFPTSGQLASWAGMCPGNHESAGKRKSGRTRQGNRYLKGVLVEAAWAAAHTKDTYLSSKYHALARRRGAKRACMAVGHFILRVAHELLRQPQKTYGDLGPEWLDRTRSQVPKQLVKRLEALGYNVTVTKRSDPGTDEAA